MEVKQLLQVKVWWDGGGEGEKGETRGTKRGDIYGPEAASLVRQNILRHQEILIQSSRERAPPKTTNSPLRTMQSTINTPHTAEMDELTGSRRDVGFARISRRRHLHHLQLLQRPPFAPLDAPTDSPQSLRSPTMARPSAMPMIAIMNAPR